MAEVTGYLGGDPIELNNAATETTLKQLVAAVTLLAAQSSKGKNAAKEVEKFAKSLLSGEKEVKKLTKTQKAEAAQRIKNIEADKAREKAEVKAAERTYAAMNSIDGLARATVSAANKLTGMVSSMANMGNSFSGAAGALGQVPLVGGLIGPVFSAIGASGDKVFKSFQQTASVGANFNGNIRSMIDAASGAGLTIDQFTGLISKNSDNLRFLGGTTSEGAKQLAALGKRLRTENVPLMNSLAGLGYSTEEISTGMARFGGMMVKSGKQLDQKALVETSGKYLQNLDAMAKLTGKSKDALQSEHDARMAESDFRLFSLKLDEKGVLASQMALDLVPKEFQAAARELLATGIPKSDAAKALFKQMPGLAQNLINMGQQAKRSGTMTEQQVLATDKAAQAEAKRQIELSKSGKGVTDVLGQFGSAGDKAISVGLAELAARGDASEALAETAKTAKDAAKATGDALSPAQLMEAQQKIAIQSNEMSALLAARMPELEKAFTTLVEYINTPLRKAFNFMMDNFKTITLAVGVAAGVLTGLKVLFTGADLVKKLFGERGSPGNPMHVVGGGFGGGDAMYGDTGKDGKKKRSPRRKTTKLGRVGDFLKKAGPSAKTAGRLVKGTALLNVGMAGYNAYSEFQDIDQQVAEGKMAKEEAKKAKTVATTKATGTATGAVAAAAAGAALGTLIFPGVGTVIGGVVGGVLGSMAGEAAGEAVGKVMTDDQSGYSQRRLSADSKKKAHDWALQIYSGKADISQVPLGLRDEVNKILKKPPTAWKMSGISDKRTKAAIPAPPKGTDISVLESRTKAAAIPVPPKGTDISVSQKDMVASAVKTKAEAQASLSQAQKQAAEEMKKTGVDLTTIKPLTGQESPETLLASLNTKMEAMLKLNSRFVDLASRQLTVQQGLSGNLLKAV